MTNKSLLRLLSIFFLISIQNFSAQEILKESSPDEVGMSRERLNRITNRFQKYVDDGELPGVVILVARKGEIPYFKAIGYSDLEKKEPIQKNTIFRIASQTKALVSLGVLILQEQGKLVINEDVGKYLPSFYNINVAVKNEDGSFNLEPPKQNITIRDLLRHTSGVSYGDGFTKDVWEKNGITGWYFAEKERPILETVNQIATLPFDAHPGEQFVYGYNTDILGALIEVVSGKTLEAYLEEEILKPLEMTDTHFYLPESKASRLSVVYANSDQGLERLPETGGIFSQGAYIEGPRKSFSGGAGYLSTAMDYLKFLQMMLNNGVYKDKRIISRKTVELMTSNHLGDIEYPWGDGVGFGLGFYVLENVGELGQLGSKNEYGWSGAYHTTYWVDPQEELIVLYFTQLLRAGNIKDRDVLRALVYQSITD